MAIALPTEIARYFASDRSRDAAGVSSCFTADTIVRDEGQAYTGRDAIRKWAAGSFAKYDCTVVPFAIVHEDDRAVVTSHVVGNFPGSPVDLRYQFTLADGAVVRLEITL